ncbi:plasmid partition protein ParG [Bartonella sp. CB178]|uniref:plasmid partition protein ParG n=1 Tax=Bartonella sp. CB178 TaxID=3112255 RepID=UPI00300DF8B3
MSKKIKIGTKPTSKSIPATADAWVESRTINTDERMKRLTIDVPESLHRSIKMSCASRGTKIADEVRELLIQKYEKEQK